MMRLEKNYARLHRLRNVKGEARELFNDKSLLKEGLGRKIYDIYETTFTDDTEITISTKIIKIIFRECIIIFPHRNANVKH